MEITLEYIDLTSVYSRTRGSHIFFFKPMSDIRSSKLSVVYLLFDGLCLPCFNPFPNKPWISCVCSTSLLKTLGKGEIDRYKQFLLFPECFLPV